MDRSAVSDRDGFTHDCAEQPPRSCNTDLCLRGIDYKIVISPIIDRHAVCLTITRQNSQGARNPGRIGYDACAADVQFTRNFDYHRAIDLELRATSQSQIMEAVGSIRQSGDVDAAQSQVARACVI